MKNTPAFVCVQSFAVGAAFVGFILGQRRQGEACSQETSIPFSQCGGPCVALDTAQSRGTSAEGRRKAETCRKNPEDWFTAGLIFYYSVCLGLTVSGFPRILKKSERILISILKMSRHFEPLLSLLNPRLRPLERASTDSRRAKWAVWGH